MQRFFPILLLCLCLLPACGWDDDSIYEARTRASYLIVDEGVAGALTVHRYQNGLVEESWNERFGVTDAAFSGLQFFEESLWMGDAGQNRILQINPATDEIDDSFGDLPIRPDVFAVGERHIFIGDTSTQELAFVRRRNRETFTTDLGDRPGPMIYNNRLFFIQKGDSNLTVYDELALSPRTDEVFPHPLQEIQFNTLLNVNVSLNDGNDDFQGTVSGTSGFLSGGISQINYQKIRFSPYLEARFGSEWLDDLRLFGDEVITGGFTLPDSITNFEVDFFESRFFYIQGDSLQVYDLAEQAAVTALPVSPGALVRSVHWVGGSE